MKPKLLGRIAVAAVLLLSAATATAHDFEVDDIYYNIDKFFGFETGYVEVTYASNYPGSECYGGDVIIPSEIQYQGKTYPVGLIGLEAFRGCSSLRSVSIPTSVKYISSFSFSDCTQLTSLAIPDSVARIGDHAFSGCSSLQSISLPNSLTEISVGTFQYCSNLECLTIPSCVTKIGLSICKNLGIISVDNANPVYDSRDNCNAIIESVSNTLIWGCKNTIIPNSVIKIGP